MNFVTNLTLLFPIKIYRIKIDNNNVLLELPENGSLKLVETNEFNGDIDYDGV